MLFDRAEWIMFQTGEKKDALSGYGNPAPYFRAVFVCDGKVKKATWSVSAIGVFKAYINGKEADDDYLSPGWTDYRVRIPYMVYDVTDKIQKNNALGIVAGDGWAVGKVGNCMFRCNYYDEIEVIASLKIEYLDGRVQYVNTGRNWKASSGEIVRSDLYMGEYIDKRLSLGDFSVYGYDDSNWQNAKINTEVYWGWPVTSQYLQKAIAPKTTVKHMLTPQLMFKKENKFYYDFKQNFAGVASVVVSGERGAALVLRHAEMMIDGALYTENLRRAEATDTFVLAGDKEEYFRPLFTFHGFRYLEITVTGNAEIKEVKGLVMYSDLKETGSFSCSDDTVNKIYNNAVWSQRGNFINVPTDCPQRDERLGWTGDAQVFCGSAMFNMDCKAFFEKYLADVRDAQLGNGGIPGMAPVIPHYNYTCERQYINAAGWGDVITVLPYTHYVMYGDKKVIKDNIANCKRFLKFSINNSENCILPADNNWGDWLSVGNDSDKSALATMFFANSALLTAKMCGIIGDDDAGYYYGLYQDIKKAFRKEFIGGNNVIASDTQTCYLLAYAFGLMTAEEVKDNLLRAIRRKNDHLSTGFLGIKHLLPVLCELGEEALAYKILTNKTYPSWGYTIENGATTIWERWNSYTIEHGLNDPGMNSFNHYSLGSCVEWMFKYCLGIMPGEKPDEAGFKKITLRPFFDTGAGF